MVIIRRKTDSEIAISHETWGSVPWPPWFLAPNTYALYKAIDGSHPVLGDENFPEWHNRAQSELGRACTGSFGSAPVEGNPSRAQCVTLRLYLQNLVQKGR